MRVNREEFLSAVQAASRPVLASKLCGQKVRIVLGDDGRFSVQGTNLSDWSRYGPDESLFAGSTAFLVDPTPVVKVAKAISDDEIELTLAPNSLFRIKSKNGKVDLATEPADSYSVLEFDETTASQCLLTWEAMRDLLKAAMWVADDSNDPEKPGYQTGGVFLERHDDVLSAVGFDTTSRMMVASVTSNGRPFSASIPLSFCRNAIGLPSSASNTCLLAVTSTGVALHAGKTTLMSKQLELKGRRVPPYRAALAYESVVGRVLFPDAALEIASPVKQSLAVIGTSLKDALEKPTGIDISADSDRFSCSVGTDSGEAAVGVDVGGPISVEGDFTIRVEGKYLAKCVERDGASEILVAKLKYGRSLRVVGDLDSGVSWTALMMEMPK